ncbi:hypothetical protein [Halobacterium salinarum]|uniref:hypothetical protein n=1 Tax=Halobacterium salinarum TaxID=2242 RepID=UPI0025573F8E|nr:hypothetical protein [Halobacterium salinarum]MDL0123497.1 hypothetical protein [Halobacterium salinarum]MDL0130395.1 hypothetical protein [Halobacterium salinarum]
MNDDGSSWVGVGSTPQEAVEDLVPNQDQEDIAWVEGVPIFPDRSDPQKGQYRASITVMYESRSAKQRNVTAVCEENTWRAYFIGGKNLPY